MTIGRNIVAMVLVLAITVFSGCGDKPPQQGTSENGRPTLTVGIQTSPAMTLVMVAEDKGFFDTAGVDVEIREFTAGKFALQAFLGGSLDIAVSGEVPVTLSTLQGNRFRVIAQVVERTINECRVIVRKEDGLDTPEKYFGAKKRRLATSFGGGPEFFTYNFLKKHGIGADQVELISQKPEDMPAALANGTVDAVAIFDPQARIAERELGEAGLTFADADIYSELYVCDVMEETLQGRRDDLIAFLKGLHQAQFFVRDSPEESKQILMKYTKLEKAIVDDIWDNFVFKPAINDLFVEYTTAEAKWVVEKGVYPPDTEIPDYRAVLEPELLRGIDPGAVVLDGDSARKPL